MRTIFLFLVCIFSQLLYAQGPSSSGGSLALSYLGLEPCGDPVTNQFIILEVGGAGYNFKGSAIQIVSSCITQSQSYSITDLASNATVVAQMNNMAPCLKPVFIDLYTTANGFAPPNAKVFVFVGPNPDLTTFPSNTYENLCGGDVVYVAFGNYTGSDLFLPNISTLSKSCGNIASVKVISPSVSDQITYTSNRLVQGQGSFVQKNILNGTLTYGTTKNCSAQILYCQTPSITFSGDTELCPGELTTIQCLVQPNPGNYDYMWSNGQSGMTLEVKPSVTSKYTATITTGQRYLCTHSADLIIDVFSAPSLSISAKKANGNNPCLGDEFSLQWLNQPQHQTMSSYHWLGPDGSILGPDQPIVLEAHTAGVYKLVVLYANGCTIEKEIDVQPPAQVPVRICTNSPICENNLELEANSTDGVIFEWFGPNVYYAVGANQIVDWIDFEYGLYTVVVTNADGCTNKGEVWGIYSPNCQGGYRPEVSMYTPNSNITDSTEVRQKEEKLIEERSIENVTAMSLYPNPASDELNIRSLNNIRLVEVQIFDLLGKMTICLKVPPSDVHKIALPNLSSGLYLLRAKDEFGLYHSKKFVINKI